MRSSLSEEKDAGLTLRADAKSAARFRINRNYGIGSSPAGGYSQAFRGSASRISVEPWSN